MPLDLHRLFSGAPERDFISALAVGKQQEDILRSARDDIRAALKSALGNLAQFSHLELFESTSSVRRLLQPKFRMQGSFSYRTCNAPAQNPPQEVDLDDGMFVPISYLSANGQGAGPALLSKGLFAAVETALEPLRKRKGWQIKQKPSCVRIQINSQSHTDIALYSIPDGEFSMLVGKAQMSEDSTMFDSLQKSFARDELPEFLYRQISQSQIMLAHRVEGWKPSDPRKLEDWFRDAVGKYGEHLRRICRYLKGWRDYTWEECKLSSIILMAAATKVFKENPSLAKYETRDDKALLTVCEMLPGILSNPIENPGVLGQWLDEGWSPEQRAEYVSAVDALAEHV